MNSIVQMQETPNPNARKFVLPKKVFSQGSNFASAQAAASHPLAQQLFELPGVYNVFWAQDFITINKLPNLPWEPLTTQAQKLIAVYWQTLP
jgi:hypothetical protein